MIRSSWGEKLRQVFESIDDPQWDGAGAALAPLCVPSARYEPMKKIPTRTRRWIVTPRRDETRLVVPGPT